jgi:hypothetical protein
MYRLFQANIGTKIGCQTISTISKVHLSLLLMCFGSSLDRSVMVWYRLQEGCIVCGILQ